MTVASSWAELAAELHRDRLAWADEAFNAFRSKLLPEVQAALSHQRSDCDVVLYGVSQAGKSTLALALLGVPDDDRFDKVECVLRGGRTLGASVTAAPSRYVLADADVWQFGFVGDVRDIGEDEIGRELNRIRDDVEVHQWDPTRLLHIGVPRRYVIDSSARTLRLIDLPGVEPHNPDESRYVDKVIPSWVEAADVVLLMGEATQETFVNPEEIGIEGLRTWYYLPDRFRVVLTRAFTARSRLKAITKDHGAAAADFWRDHFVGELRRNGRTRLPATPAAEWLHPFDFGASIRTTAKDRFLDPTIWPPIIAARDEALDRLRDDLVAAARPETRIRSAFRAGQVTRSVRADRIKRLDREVLAAETKRDTADNVLDSRRRAAESEEQAQTEGSARWEALDVARQRAGSLRMPSAVDVAYVEHETADKLRHRLRVQYGQVWDDWRAEFPQILDPYPQTDDDGSARDDIEQTLAAAVKKRSFVFRFTQWGSDRLAARVNRERAAGAAALESLLRARADRHLDLIEARLRDADGKTADAISRTAERVKSAERDRLDAVEQVCTARRRRREESERLAAGVTAAEQFPDLLRDSYLAHHRFSLLRVAAANGKVERLAAAVAVLDAARLYDTIRRQDA